MAFFYLPFFFLISFIARHVGNFMYPKTWLFCRHRLATSRQLLRLQADGCFIVWWIFGTNSIKISFMQLSTICLWIIYWHRLHVQDTPGASRSYMHISSGHKYERRHLSSLRVSFACFECSWKLHAATTSIIGAPSAHRMYAYQPPLIGQQPHTYCMHINHH
jgi:hypothetical protein